MCYHLPKIFKAIIIIAIIAPPSSSKTLEYSECLGITELDTFVSSKRSCSKYIYCNGESSFEGECLGGNFFNEAQGICDDPENVQCDIVEGDGVVSIFDETFQKFEADKNVESLEGDSIEGDDTGFGGTVEVSSELEENIIHLSNAPKCDKANRGIRHIPHQDSCAAFFTCYNGIAIPMLCPKNSYFNPETEICDHKMPNKCKLPYSIRLNCRKGVYDYMPHPQRCEYYHYCLNGFLMIMRCPYEFTWNYERRTCVHKTLSKCYTESSALSQQPIIYRSHIESDKS